MSNSILAAGGLGSTGSQAGHLGFRSRGAILAAAKDCFSRRGIETVSFADIAARANVAEAEVREAYGTKSRLLMAIFDEAWSTINPRIADIIATSPDARRAMTSMLSAAAQILQKDPALARLMLLESYRLQPDGRVLMSRGYSVFIQMSVALVERGQQRGVFKTNFHPRVIVSLVFATVLGMMRDALLAEDAGPSPYSMPQLIASFEAVVSSISH